MFKCRIRLFRIPGNRVDLVRPRKLLIEVFEADGTSFFTATLAEAIVHLRSTRGARLYIEEDTRVFIWGGGRSEERARHLPSMATLMIDRDQDGFVVRQASAGPSERSSPDSVHDFSRDEPVELAGRARKVTVDLEIDPSTLKVSHDWHPLPQDV
jgi:hypothetical protein